MSARWTLKLKMFRTCVVACLLLGLAVSCDEGTLPVLEAPAPPPPRSAIAPAALLAAPPPGQAVGSLPQAPMPRFAVAVFAPATGRAGEEATYAPRWTTAVLNRFDASHIGATALEAQGALESDLDAGTASLAGLPGAKSADLLIAGTVLPGATAQVRLLTRDTKDGRLIARSEFEGQLEPALDRAVEDAFQEAHRYWFELGRGRFTQLRVEVRGLRTNPEVAQVQGAVATVSGVQLVRHIETQVEGAAAHASYLVTFEGAPDTLLEGMSRLTWGTPPAAGHLTRTAGMSFEAGY